MLSSSCRNLLFLAVSLVLVQSAHANDRSGRSNAINIFERLDLKFWIIRVNYMEQLVQKSTRLSKKVHQNLLYSRKRIEEHGIKEKYMMVQEIFEIAASARSIIHKKVRDARSVPCQPPKQVKADTKKFLIFFICQKQIQTTLDIGFQFGHTADVLSVSINGSNSRMFVFRPSTIRLWDTRVASRAVRTFHGHGEDVNAVKFFQDGNRIGSGSDDGTCRLLDTRTGHQLQEYCQPHGDNEVPHVTSIAFSISGRLLFDGYNNGDCYVWDTLLVVLNLGSLQNSHDGRNNCLGLSDDGNACTESCQSSLSKPKWEFCAFYKQRLHKAEIDEVRAKWASCVAHGFGCRRENVFDVIYLDYQLVDFWT